MSFHYCFDQGSRRLETVAAIHWQALRLWLKRTSLYTHPKNIKGAAPVPSAPIGEEHSGERVYGTG